MEGGKSGMESPFRLRCSFALVNQRPLNFPCLFLCGELEQQYKIYSTDKLFSCPLSCELRTLETRQDVAFNVSPLALLQNEKSAAQPAIKCTKSKEKKLKKHIIRSSLSCIRHFVTISKCTEWKAEWMKLTNF